MSKRRRDGPVAIQNKRYCPSFAVPVFASLKRKRDEEPLGRVGQRQRHSLTPVVLSGHKRSADFDEEVEHLQKRMRATVPTAVEAMAFLLPHLLRLRSMYIKSQERVELLEQNNTLISQAYNRVVLQNQHLKQELERKNELVNANYQHVLLQNQQLKRDLALERYRWTMNATKPYNA